MNDTIKRRIVTVNGTLVRYTYNTRNREVAAPSVDLTFTATSYDSAPYEIKEAIANAAGVTADAVRCEAPSTRNTTGPHTTCSTPRTDSREPHDYEPDHERQPSAMNTDPHCRLCGEPRRECERRLTHSKRSV